MPERGLTRCRIVATLYAIQRMASRIQQGERARRDGEGGELSEKRGICIEN